MQGAIHVAGNAVVDVLVRVPATLDLSEPSGDRWGKGTHLLEEPVEVLLGGCGAAAAYVLGRLGHPVILNTNLSRDVLGDLVRQWLDEARVEVLDGAHAEATAAHIVHLDEAGGRRSVYYAGDKVRWERSLDESSPAWLLASGYGRVDAEDARGLELLFSRSRQRGTRVAFDPSPWFAGRASAELMSRLWGQVDLLLGTEEELTHWCPAASPQALAAALKALGPERVVVKRGRDGAVYAAADGVGQIGTRAVAAGNTIGAGDTFNACLVGQLARGADTRTAVTAAVDLATGTVARGRGALGALA
ncbi:carbohydrate kinase family protein [Candidatus Latescibacterota bacterium]